MGYRICEEFTMQRSRILWSGTLILGLTAGAVMAQQKPPAGRNDLDPAARNKVANVMARSYLEESSAKALVQKQQVTSPGGANGCTTNIGSTSSNTNASGIGNRYGTSNNDQVIVVKGPVVNICK
jgi:hypothetical protein